MSKLFKSLSLLLIAFVAIGNYSNAQLNAGQLGIGAMFAGSQPYASFNYALANNMEVGLNLLYISETKTVDNGQTSETGDASTTLGFKEFLNIF